MSDLKYYLGSENDRNAKHSQLYTRLLRKAVGDSHEIVITGHHFMFAPSTGNEEEDMKHTNEIPSADTLLFDHEIMHRVFGDRAMDIMVELAKTPCDNRESVVSTYLDAIS